MTAAPDPVAVGPATRPEVAALAAALAEQFTDHIELDRGLATDLLVLIADLCGPGHIACWACGEAYVCTPCGLGDPSLWCWCPSGFGSPLCPTCTEANCAQCANGSH